MINDILCARHWSTWVAKSEDIIEDDPDMDDAHNAMPTYRSVNSNAGSAEALGLVRHWIRECQETHQVCASIETPGLPTRLIDTQDDGTAHIRLVNGADIHGNYVALSYCWGQGAPGATTTTANVSEHMTNGLLIEDLPATVRDAITITQGLGYRYLWIDRLCVIQGDAKDWAIESGKMCDVYANAILTISADNSASVWDGILHDQSYASTIGQDDVRIAGNIVRRKAPHASFVSQKTQRSMPTYRRAWTLQEQYLPRRVLHYTQNEMIWECLEKRCCECRRDFGPSRRELSPRQPSNVQLIYRNWAGIIHEYTTRALTNEQDKLPAVSGLVTRINGLIAQIIGTPDTYLAGLWKADLAAELCWLPPTKEDRDAWLRNNIGPEPSFQVPMTTLQSESDSEVDAIMQFSQALHRRLPNIDRRRPSVYTAPTWSWASLNGPAAYLPNPGLCPFHSAIEILDADTTPTNKADQFGQVSNGKITLRGPIVHGLTLQQGSNIFAAQEGSQLMVPNFQLTDFRDENQIDIQPDDPNEISREDMSLGYRHVSCLMVGHRRRGVRANQPIKEIAKREGPSFTRVGTKEYEEMDNPPAYYGDAGRQLVWDMCQTHDGWEYDDVFSVDLAPDDGSRGHVLPFSFFLVLWAVPSRPGVYKRLACFQAGWNHVARGVMKSMFKKRGTKDTITIVWSS